MVEANVCFPSDLKFLFQSIDKCLCLIGKVRLLVDLPGWGKHHYWCKLLTESSFKVTKIYRNKGKGYQKRLKQTVKEHLNICSKIKLKIGDSLLLIKELITTKELTKASLMPLYEELVLFFAYFGKHQDLVKRRIIDGEKIPHEEKLFSLYEPHTEWISKGKTNKKVELGHAVCITTNQHHFCMHWQVMEKQHDVDMPLIIRDFIQNEYGKYRIKSWSFDRNFGSPENRKELAEQVDCLVMPKKGRISKKDQQKQEETEFKKYRRKHSTVEANINQLECLGAGKCRDKKIEGFKRYVGLSVLAYNLHRLGKIRRRY